MSMQRRTLVAFAGVRWAAFATVGGRSIGLHVWPDGTHSIEQWTDNEHDREELHNGNNNYQENFSRWLHLVDLARNSELEAAL